MQARIAVIGGGAAGIAAARRLDRSGVEVLLLEASDRLGGRAHTVTRGGMALDLGAGWLHSAEHNGWVGLAAEHGFTVDRTLPNWREQWRELGFSPEERRAANAAYEALDRRMRADPPASDRAADAIEPGSRWKPYLDALSGFINGAPTGEVSIADWLAYDDAATETDWRVAEGYGTLVTAHAAGLRVAPATSVTAIDRTGTRLRIVTPRGNIETEAAIVTVSTNVLAGGAIDFGPGFDEVLHAAACLPLGLADKLFLALDGGEEIPANAHLLGNPHSAATGTYTLRPFDRPVVEVMFGGEGARDGSGGARGRRGLRDRRALQAAGERLAQAAAAGGGIGMEPRRPYPRRLQPCATGARRRTRRAGGTRRPTDTVRGRGLLADGLLDRARSL